MDINGGTPSELESINNTAWCDEHEKTLRYLHKATSTYSKRFHVAYTRYKQKHQNYRIPIIIMQAISGFASILNIGYVPQKFGKWVSLSVGFVNLLATIISMIETFKKIDQIMNKAYASFFAFKSLSDEIFIILQTPRNDRRQGGIITVNKYFVKYQTAYSNIPLLDKNDVNYLNAKIDDDGDTLTEMQQIEKQVSKINSTKYENNVIEMTEIGLKKQDLPRYDSSSSNINDLLTSEVHEHTQEHEV